MSNGMVKTAVLRPLAELSATLGTGFKTHLRIAAAYERATHHRHPPPDFGPLPNGS